MPSGFGVMFTGFTALRSCFSCSPGAFTGVFWSVSRFRQTATATHFERELGCESGFQEARPPSPPGSSLRVHGFAAHLPTKRRAGRLLTEHERKEYVDPLRGVSGPSRLVSGLPAYRGERPPRSAPRPGAARQA
jgi:hypothetical protein